MSTPPRSRRIWIWSFVLVLAVVTVLVRKASPPVSKPPTLQTIAEAQAKAYVTLESREGEIQRTLAAPALAAFRHEDVVLSLWRSIQESTDRWTQLADSFFGEIQLGTPTSPEPVGNELHRTEQRPPGVKWQQSQWQQQLAAWKTAGWMIDRITVRQVRFTPGAPAAPARSRLDLSAVLTNSIDHRLGTLRGPIEVEWKQETPEATPNPASVDATQLEWITRSGPPPFQLWFQTDIASAPTISMDPILSGDLDGDGTPELVLVGARRLLRRVGKGFEEQALPQIPPSATHAAVLCDFNRDGRIDLLVLADTGLYLLPGLPGVNPFGAPVPLWRPEDPTLRNSNHPIKHAQVLTVADIDRDGDLDVFIGQYKVPYQSGQFPTPYFDSNDGFPCYLLRNDGERGLVDVSTSAGLAPYRQRRLYSASFIDLNGDHAPDLVAVSDFAGLDLYLNDGHGNFAQHNSVISGNRHLFGMAHAFGDFNRNGLPGILAVGMDSPTAATLDSLGIARSAEDPMAAHRAQMTKGNRLLLAGNNGGWTPASWEHALAHTGWTWGPAVFDADNDGTLDVYFANGHESFANPTDYERQFWLHDIYIGSSTNNPVAELYFRSALGRRRADQQSYGGWQDNRFYRGGPDHHFLETGVLDGIGHREDCRNVLAEDFDGDGNLDLMVTSYELWPKPRQQLRIHRNVGNPAQHWIGFRLPPSGLNAQIRIQTANGSQTQWLVTGDAYRTQHSFSAHFGLGKLDQVWSVDIGWSDGSNTQITNPAVNRWHPVQK